MPLRRAEPPAPAALPVPVVQRLVQLVTTGPSQLVG